MLLQNQKIRAEQHDKDRFALLRELSRPGCPVCRAADTADRNWHTWYVVENHADPLYRQQIACAGGFCAEHLRWLITDSEGRAPLPQLFLDQITRLLALAPGKPPPSGVCPACSRRNTVERTRLTAIGDSLAADSVRKLLPDTDICLPHLIRLLHTVPWRHLDTVAETILTRLAGPADGVLLAVMLPLDSDLARSARTLVRVNTLRVAADTHPLRQTGLDHALTALACDSCPLCHAGAYAELRYTSWLLHQPLDQLDTTELWLCAKHLSIATLFGYAADKQIADLIRGQTAARVARLRQRLQTPHRSAAEWLLARRDTSEALRSPRSRAVAALDRFRHDITPCAACAAATLAQRREQALLEATLPDQRVRDRWLRGHGPCVEHTALLIGDPLPAQALHARLRLLSWELHETLRRRGWTTRNEPTTAAELSWRRAIPYLRGDTYFGCSATQWQEITDR